MDYLRNYLFVVLLMAMPEIVFSQNSDIDTVNLFPKRSPQKIQLGVAGVLETSLYLKGDYPVVDAERSNVHDIMLNFMVGPNLLIGNNDFKLMLGYGRKRYESDVTIDLPGNNAGFHEVNTYYYILSDISYGYQIRINNDFKIVSEANLKFRFPHQYYSATEYAGLGLEVRYKSIGMVISSDLILSGDHYFGDEDLGLFFGITGNRLWSVR